LRKYSPVALEGLTAISKHECGNVDGAGQQWSLLKLLGGKGAKTFGLEEHSFNQSAAPKQPNTRGKKKNPFKTIFL
jgi:hypothetical protein